MTSPLDEQSPKGPLRVLIVEDSKIEAKLTVALLRKNGFDVESERVETEGEMKRQLDESPWDIIISDYQMPLFDGEKALKLFLGYDLEIPFILVSGKIGEEAAVDLMKLGASDYIMKGNSARLIPAIESHLKEAAIRRETRALEKRLQESEAQYRGFFENAAIGIFRCDRDSRLLDVNNYLAHALGYEDRHDCISDSGRLKPEIYDPTTRRVSTVELAIKARKEDSFEAIFYRLDGSVMEAKVRVWTNHKLETDETFFEGTVEDITKQRNTERKLREMEQLDASLIDITSNL